MKQMLLHKVCVLICLISLASSSFNTDSSIDQDSTITKIVNGNSQVLTLPKEAIKILDRYGIDKMLYKVSKAKEMKRIISDQIKKVVNDLKDLHVSSSRLR